MQPKRIIITLLVVILALCSAGTIVSAEDSTTLDMAVEVSSSTALSDNALLVEEGALVTVSVAIKSNPGFSHLHFDLRYNPSVLKPVLKANNELDWKKGEVCTGATETVTVSEKQPTATNTTTGTIAYTAVKSGSNMTATGTVFTCTFKVVAHGDSLVVFDMNGKDFTDKDFKVFPADAVTAKINGVTGNTAKVLAHKYGSSVEHLPATCTEPGKDIYTCTVCHGVTTIVNENDPAKGHTETAIPSVTPTCQTAGKTEGVQCAVCKIILTPQFDIPAGEKHHVKEIDPAVAPTCQADGKTEGAHCSLCLRVITDQTVVPKLDDHVYGDWTDNGDGTQTKTCVHCGESVTENIPNTNTLLIVLIVVIVVLALVVIAGVVVLVVVLTKRKKVV